MRMLPEDVAEGVPPAHRAAPCARGHDARESYWEVRQSGKAQWRCRACRRQHGAGWRKAHPELVKARRERQVSQWGKRPTALTPEDAAEALRRLAARSVTNTETGCREWIGAKSGGHGRVCYQGHVWLTHRLAWVAFRGPIPDGFALDHLCRAKACLEPGHLRITTPENSSRNRDQPPGRLGVLWRRYEGTPGALLIRQ